MKKTRIDLSQPFEEILATVLSLPRDHVRASENGSDEDAEVKQVLRGLYEAANGRQVETVLGLVPIAPPVAPFLKEAPFEVTTQLDFLVEAMSRVIAGPSNLIEAAGPPEEVGSTNGRFAPAPAPAEVRVEPKLFASSFASDAGRLHLPPQGVSHG